jgi:hypothetical protein
MAEGEGHRENETKPGLLGGTLDSQRLALRGGRRRLGRRITAAANTSDQGTSPYLSPRSLPAVWKLELGSLDDIASLDGAEIDVHRTGGPWARRIYWGGRDLDSLYMYSRFIAKGFKVV